MSELWDFLWRKHHSSWIDKVLKTWRWTQCITWCPSTLRSIITGYGSIWIRRESYEQNCDVESYVDSALINLQTCTPQGTDSWQGAILLTIKHRHKLALGKGIFREKRRSSGAVTDRVSSAQGKRIGGRRGCLTTPWFSSSKVLYSIFLDTVM